MYCWQLEWGTSDFEQEERERPEFKADFVDSVVNGEPVKYFPPEKKFRLQIISYGIICPAILFVIGIVSVIFYTQIVITEDVKNPNNASNYSLLTSIANALQIQVLNYLYSTLAVKLTNQENHRFELLVYFFSWNLGFDECEFVCFKGRTLNMKMPWLESYLPSTSSTRMLHCSLWPSSNRIFLAIRARAHAWANWPTILPSFLVRAHLFRIRLKRCLVTVYHCVVTRLVVSKTVQFVYLFVFRKWKEMDEKREIEEARAAGELLHTGPLSQAEQVKENWVMCMICFDWWNVGNGIGRIR